MDKDSWSNSLPCNTSHKAEKYSDKSVQVDVSQTMTRSARWIDTRKRVSPHNSLVREGVSKVLNRVVTGAVN